MILATLKDGSRDGQLIVVSHDHSRYAEATGLANTLQFALDHWDEVSLQLGRLGKALDDGSLAGQLLEPSELLAPLPRAYEWIDASAYINHIMLVRKARGAAPPATLQTDPLVYQGGSGVLLAPTSPIFLKDESWGCDFESEVAVVLGDTPQGTTKTEAAACIRLVLLVNDVSLRQLIPAELEKGFGFFQSKPASAFAPLALTPDELGSAWRDGRLHLPLVTRLNGAIFGDPNAGPEMHFSFFELIEHIAKTRSFTAGTILGSGTVSNEDRRRGSSCLAEKRMIEKIDTGTISTRFLKAGDRVEIEMCGENNRSLFGRIDQRVVDTLP